jgi:hypothetical protein
MCRAFSGANAGDLSDSVVAMCDPELAEELWSLSETLTGVRI